MRFGFCSMLCAMNIVLLSDSGWSRVFRIDMMPNGGQMGCLACHDGAGGPRNAFGLAVEARVTPGGMEPFWSAALAALDSDGDG
ncbi:MAG: hypothetical protein ACE15F_17000, partial [bacterium]